MGGQLRRPTQQLADATFSGVRIPTHLPRGRLRARQKVLSEGISSKGTKAEIQDHPAKFRFREVWVFLHQLVELTILPFIRGEAHPA